VARVFADTNVLFPFSLMDLMLALTEDAVHEIVWTRRLLDEWERVIVREHQRTPEAARRITDAIRTYFDDCEVPESAYAHLLDTVPGRDPDDRHHTAAAIAARAGVLVTWNLEDFPAGPLADHGVRVLDPDIYLCELLAAAPVEVTETVRRMADEKTRPPMTAADLADRFAKAGAPAFADRLRELL
jgi:predicted nucleic acid-binding protein